MAGYPCIVGWVLRSAVPWLRFATASLSVFVFPIFTPSIGELFLLGKRACGFEGALKGHVLSIFCVSVWPLFTLTFLAVMLQVDILDYLSASPKGGVEDLKGHRIALTSKADMRRQTRIDVSIVLPGTVDYKKHTVPMGK